MKIYVITAGEYSDYHICAVTDDKKSAERLRKIYSSHWREARVETYDTKYIYEDPRSYWSFEVSLNGAIITGELLYFREEEETEINEVELVGTKFYINVIAKDRSHAEKIAFDKIAEYKYEHPEEVEEAIAEEKRWSDFFGRNGFSMSSSCIPFTDAESAFGNGSMASASFTVYEPDERTRGFGSINER